MCMVDAVLFGSPTAVCTCHLPQGLEGLPEDPMLAAASFVAMAVAGCKPSAAASVASQAAGALQHAYAGTGQASKCAEGIAAARSASDSSLAALSAAGDEAQRRSWVPAAALASVPAAVWRAEAAAGKALPLVAALLTLCLAGSEPHASQALAVAAASILNKLAAGGTPGETAVLFSGSSLTKPL